MQSSRSNQYDLTEELKYSPRRGVRLATRVLINVRWSLQTFSPWSYCLFCFPLVARQPVNMAGNEDQAYSQLEVLPYSQLEVSPQHRREKPLPTDLGKQVVPEDGKQHALERVGIEVDPNGNFTAQSVEDPQVHIHRSSRMKWMLFVGVLSLVVIAAAVLGGVFGSRHKNHGTARNASSTNHSNSSISSSSARSNQRNIAALSYSLNSVNNTRVYFQDDDGQIIEAANSADNPKWNISRIGIGGKNGSAMAAAVSRPGFPLVDQDF